MKKFFLIFITVITVITIITFIKPVGAAAASFSLSPATATKSIGEVFNVDIVLDTAGEAVSGATAVINYDSARLQVTTGGQITNGSLFTQPLTNTVSGGQIRYDSGSLGTTYTGRGVMATISFRTLAAGTAQVTFAFDPAATTGTSMVAASGSPTNILSAVNNGVYTISGGGTTTLPPSGAVENTIMMLGGGLLLLGVGAYKFYKSYNNYNNYT